jgi:hypothetical protein
VVLALVLLESLAWLVEFPRFQLRIGLAREVASKADPLVLAQQQALTLALKELVTEALEGGRLGQEGH